MSFAKRLKQARKRQGLTQEELGKKSGLSTYTIQRYEYGKLNPKKDTVSKLAAALNLSYSHTQSGEPFFFTFIDTLPSPEYEDAEKFNQDQYQDAIEKSLEDIKMPKFSPKISKSLGEKIKELRASKEFTIDELSELSGVSQEVISCCENDGIVPSINNILCLAVSLDVSSSELFKCAYGHVPNWICEKNTSENETEFLLFPSTVEKINCNIEKLNKQGQEKLYNYSCDLLEIPKYRADTAPDQDEAAQNEAVSSNQGKPDKNQ